MSEHDKDFFGERFEAMLTDWDVELKRLTREKDENVRELALCAKQIERDSAILAQFSAQLAPGLSGVTDEDWERLKAECRTVGERLQTTARYVNGLQEESAQLMARLKAHRARLTAIEQEAKEMGYEL